MRAGVILFPGINREGDVARALRQATGVKPAIVWHAEHELPPGLDLVVLPGGFSYGDYLRCGAIAARSPIMRAVADHAAGGGLVLGICNGFQILCEAGLLPGVLMRNAGSASSAKCSTSGSRTPKRRSPAATRRARWSNSPSPTARETSSPTTTRFAESRRRGASRSAIATPTGKVGAASNPNGSMNSIAGVFNDRFNVLGLMPHPENLIDPLAGGVDGRALIRFARGVKTRPVAKIRGR